MKFHSIALILAKFHEFSGDGEWTPKGKLKDLGKY